MHRLFATVSLVCAWLVCGPSEAADPPPVEDAASLTQAAVRHFESGRFEEAAAQLDAALAKARDPELLGRILLYQGMTRVIMDGDDAGTEAFSTALRFDPSLRLDPEQHKPALVRAFAQAASRQVGEVAVRAQASGTRVFLDGEARGEAPLRIRVPAGIHHLRLVRPGQGPELSARLRVFPGKRLVVRQTTEGLAMDPPRQMDLSVGPRGDLSVRCNLSEAEVFLDGQALGRTPFWGEVPAGLYEVLVRSLDGKLAWRGRAQVLKGRREVLHAVLDPRLTPEARGATAASAAQRHGAPTRTRGGRALVVSTVTLGGLALGCAAASLGVGLSAQSDYRRWDAGLAEWEATTDATRQRELEAVMQRDQAEAEDKALAFNVLVATGAVLGASAIILAIVAATQGTEPRRARGVLPSRAVSIAPGVQGLEVRF